MHSRETEATGAESELLDFLNLTLVGVQEARTSKNGLSVRIGEGIRDIDIIPEVIKAISFWGRMTWGDYNPDVYQDNQRWAVEPVESGGDDMPYRCTPGLRQGPIDIGVPYEIFVQ